MNSLSRSSRFRDRGYYVRDTQRVEFLFSRLISRNGVVYCDNCAISSSYCEIYKAD